jgi:hypothetical protein
MPQPSGCRELLDRFALRVGSPFGEKLLAFSENLLGS